MTYWLPDVSWKKLMVMMTDILTDTLLFFCNIAGIPQCHWYGRHEDFDCIVMDLLGSSLKQLRQSVHHIPLSIVMDLGCQMVNKINIQCFFLTR